MSAAPQHNMADHCMGPSGAPCIGAMQAATASVFPT